MSSSTRGQAPEPTPKTGGRDRSNSRGEATRLLLLEKAEELFAHRGISAVPLRDIGTAAGQKNNVVVQYHFGDRERLIREIAAYRGRLSEQVRVELLADLFATGRSPRVADLVRAWIRALSCHLEADNFYLAFLSRYVIERGGYVGLEGMEISNTIYTFTSMLRRLLPTHPGTLLDERWMVMMTSAVHTLARYQTSLRAGGLPAPLPRLVADLVVLFAAALEAPPAGIDVGVEAG
ncbi:TetR family transcriptional regulator [Pseudofrankia inefficax]|uniref:Regulatory protein TetR n=1 Tax=Pseudofrankia inefficax (strain DSM 45817 / CECT 9037 / DDB 130130 / EuI1c) TaxID=298654 RepID=E3J906_PSEI1|nr:TetR family transcriptional regulator [Pseudofrankia inefficax]ADP80885.1 regulatory protein TetR [Pseudofrankia inefficax]